MKIKTQDLIGAALDWAVATCQGYKNLRVGVFSGVMIMDPPRVEYGAVELSDLCYCADWAQGGPIIDCLFKQGLRLHTAEYMTGVHNKELLVASLDSPNGFWFGPTPLVAAMRCYVASELGDEVEIPEELL